MKRRDLLKYTALATGAALSAPLISSLLTSCASEVTDTAGTDQLHFFNQQEFELVSDLVDLILPKTDSPSASEVGVHHMIDAMVGTVYLENDKSAYKKRFTALTAHLDKTAGGKAFLQLEPNQKLDLLKQLSGSKEAAEIGQALLNFKQQTVAYYLSTEEIGENYLNYLPVPGEYNSCITLEEAGGKAWHYEL